MERICTDIALLNNGQVAIQGKLTDIKTKYRSDEYLLETETEAAQLALLNAFPGAEKLGRTQLTFREKQHTQFDVLQFLTKQRIPLLKLERIEPSLEDLFMEVVDK